MCTAQNFAVGYIIGNSAKSSFEACNATWDSASATKQTAFSADGTFNAIVTGCTAKFFDASSDNTYITYETKGSGVVKVPMLDEALCDNDSYKSVLSDDIIPLK
jgi:hypothetical protein